MGIISRHGSWSDDQRDDQIQIVSQRPWEYLIAKYRRIVTTNPELDTGNNSSSVGILVGPYVDVALTDVLTWPIQPQLSGDQIAFTISYSNTGKYDCNRSRNHLFGERNHSFWSHVFYRRYDMRYHRCIFHHLNHECQLCSIHLSMSQRIYRKSDRDRKHRE